jgi:hypothetical protein
MESGEDTNHTRKSGLTSKNSHKKTRFSNNKGKPSKGNSKCCEYHKTDMHDTSKCSVLKKMKEGRRNNSSDKEPLNKNKMWTKKSDDAKKFTKKELNTLVKKATSKKVVKKQPKSRTPCPSTSEVMMTTTDGQVRTMIAWKQLAQH